MNFFSYLGFEEAILFCILIGAPYIMRGDSGRGKPWYYKFISLFSFPSVVGIDLGEQSWSGHTTWVECAYDERLLCRNQIVVWCDVSLSLQHAIAIFALSHIQTAPDWFVSIDELGTLSSGDAEFDKLFRAEKAGQYSDARICKKFLGVSEVRESIYRLSHLGAIGIRTQKSLLGLVFEDNLQTKELFAVRREQLVQELIGLGAALKSL